MTVKRSHWYWTILLSFSMSSVCLAQTDPEVRQLEPGKPFERELGGGDVNVYAANSAAANSSNFVVDKPNQWFVH